VDGIGAGGQRRVDDRVDPQVALGGSGRPDAHRNVGQPGVQRLGIRIAVDGDRFDAELVAARMIRTAISPRLATRTRRNGTSAPLSPRGPASLCKDAASAGSERDVAMLLSWVRVALVRHRLEGADQRGRVSTGG
jgi:hypothetical protein